MSDRNTKRVLDIANEDCEHVDSFLSDFPHEDPEFLLQQNHYLFEKINSLENVVRSLQKLVTSTSESLDCDVDDLKKQMLRVRKKLRNPQQIRNLPQIRISSPIPNPGPSRSPNLPLPPLRTPLCARAGPRIYRSSAPQNRQQYESNSLPTPILDRSNSHRMISNSDPRTRGWSLLRDYRRGSMRSRSLSAVDVEFVRSHKKRSITNSNQILVFGAAKSASLPTIRITEKPSKRRKHSDTSISQISDRLQALSLPLSPPFRSNLKKYSSTWPEVREVKDSVEPNVVNSFPNVSDRKLGESRRLKRFEMRKSNTFASNRKSLKNESSKLSLNCEVKAQTLDRSPSPKAPPAVPVLASSAQIIRTTPAPTIQIAVPSNDTSCSDSSLSEIIEMKSTAVKPPVVSLPRPPPPPHPAPPSLLRTVTSESSIEPQCSQSPQIASAINLTPNEERAMQIHTDSDGLISSDPFVAASNFSPSQSQVSNITDQSPLQFNHPLDQISVSPLQSFLPYPINMHQSLPFQPSQIMLSPRSFPYAPTSHHAQQQQQQQQQIPTDTYHQQHLPQQHLSPPNQFTPHQFSLLSHLPQQHQFPPSQRQYQPRQPPPYHCQNSGVFQSDMNTFQFNNDPIYQPQSRPQMLNNSSFPPQCHPQRFSPNSGRFVQNPQFPHQNPSLPSQNVYQNNPNYEYFNSQQTNIQIPEIFPPNAMCLPPHDQRNSLVANNNSSSKTQKSDYFDDSIVRESSKPISVSVSAEAFKDHSIKADQQQNPSLVPLTITKNSSFLANEPSENEIQQFLNREEIVTAVSMVIRHLLPSEHSESVRFGIFRFVSEIVRKAVGSQVYPHGSFALKTYLPDGDIDLSAFFSHSRTASWAERVTEELMKEINKPTIDPLFRVQNIIFVNADPKLVKSQIGRITVDISANRTEALSTIAFFEEIDQLIGKNHLFKRTILLSKAWMKHEVSVLGSSDGMLSSYCLRVMILFIFNAFYSEIDSPLAGLFKLCRYLITFDWNNNVLSMYGPIPLKNMSQNPINRQMSLEERFRPIKAGLYSSTWPIGVKPLISHELVAKYSDEYAMMFNQSSECSTDIKSRNFSVRSLNIIGPINPFNNLSKSIIRKNAEQIKASFRDSAQILANAVVTCFTDGKCDSQILIHGLFKNTLSRYLTTFAPIVSANSLQSDGFVEIETKTEQNPKTSVHFDENQPNLKENETIHIEYSPLNGEKDSKIPRDVLKVDLTELLRNVDNAKQYDIPLNISENDLVKMICEILLKHESVPIGQMGSLLHSHTNKHSLPTMLKDRYGGLKKFIQNHNDIFQMSNDHPFNPTLSLVSPSTVQENLSTQSNNIVGMISPSLTDSLDNSATHFTAQHIHSTEFSNAAGFERHRSRRNSRISPRTRINSIERENSLSDCRLNRSSIESQIAFKPTRKKRGGTSHHRKGSIGGSNRTRHFRNEIPDHPSSSSYRFPH
uniref:PAP/OAS1 substrate-binding-related domain-containing protein n=1 Tax=Hirondellea gigas TaxID=1518452 RepID=A0A6A7G9I3_9CRUS